MEAAAAIAAEVSGTTKAVQLLQSVICQHQQQQQQQQKQQQQQHL
jgi:hypothetical protein